MPAEKLKKAEHERIYHYLYLTRHTDEVSVRKYRQGQLQETIHSSIGEEAVAVGCGIQLRPDDYILPSLRSRGFFFVKGITSNEMMAGMYGKVTGPARGKYTSHHMGDMKRGVVWGTGLIGSSLPVAVGVALGVKMAHRDNVVMVSFGDGASSRGDTHESMNLASVWKLPVIFVCENNNWAMSTPRSKQMAIDKISIRAAGYNMPGVTVDGDNVLETYNATEIAIERARKGEGPSLIECVTHRWGGHFSNDVQTYRDPKEIENCKEHCPIVKYGKYLLDQGICTAADLERIEKAVIQEVDDAIAYAEQSAAPSPDIVATHVYA